MLSWLAVHAEVASIQNDLDRRSAAALAAAGHDWASIVFDGRDGLLVGQPASARQREAAADLVRGIWGVRGVRTLGSGPTTLIADLPIEPVRDAAASLHAPTDVTPDILADAEPSAIAQPVNVATTVAALSLKAHEADAATAATAAQVADAPTAVRLANPQHTTLAAREQAAASEAMTAVGTSTGVAEQPADIPHAAAPPVPPEAAKAEVPPAPHAPSAVQPVPAPARLADVATADAVPSPKSVPAAVNGSAAAAEVAKKPTVASAPPAGPAASPATDTHGAAPPVERSMSGPPAIATGAPQTSTTPTPPAAKATGDATPADAVPLPEPRPRRFETAALPPGNIPPTTACLDDVRGAARRVEVHFGHDVARLDKHGKALIDGLVSTLNACPGAVLNIAGHADASGRSSYNRALSQRRARGVAAYIAEKGIDAGRLLAIGYGDGRPLAPNNTRANRARNRRIELTVSALSAPLPPMPVRKQGTRNGLSHR